MINSFTLLRPYRVDLNRTSNYIRTVVSNLSHSGTYIIIGDLTMKIEFQVNFKADIPIVTLVELLLLLVQAYLGQ